jgi:hypothetical protein
MMFGVAALVAQAALAPVPTLIDIHSRSFETNHNKYSCRLHAL